MRNIILMIISSILIGYLLGSINPSYIISKYKGFDIRTKGSGNAGASNALILLGKTTGVLCALFDIFKAYLSVKISTRLFPIFKIAGILSGTSCILGHMFPITMNFKGGKGLACLAGMCIAYDARLFLILLLIEFVIAFVTTYICFVATTGSTIFAIVMLIKNGLLYSLIFSPVVISIWMKHRINFRRIRYGVEAKFEFLWNKKHEKERIQSNWNKLTLEEKEYVNLLELV